MPKNSIKPTKEVIPKRWVVCYVENELYLWSGFGWVTDLKLARVYTDYADADRIRKTRVKKAFVEEHPWDRYAD